VWTATPLGAAVGGLVARATEPADVALLAAGASVAAAVAAVAVRSRPAATDEGSDGADARVAEKP
jgi:predicted MFS family arabinose efflux permease